MGQKEGTNEKGLFPANFTRPIWSDKLGNNWASNEPSATSDQP